MKVTIRTEIPARFLALITLVVMGGAVGLPRSAAAIDISPTCGEKHIAETIGDPALLQFMAEQGDVEAQSKLGAALLSGKGVKRNEEHGIAWLKKAAARNSREAQSTLGGHYFEQAGRGAGDIALAVPLLEAAAAQGDAWAEFRLSALYLRGFGVAKSLEKARALLRKSAESGLPFAQYMLGLELRGPLPSEKNSADKYYGFAIDRQSAFAWMKLAADSGNCIAVVALGLFYLDEVGTKADPREAKRLLETMYERGGEGAPLAAYFLGELYADEKTELKDVKMARQWLNIAAQAGLREAVRLLEKLSKAEQKK